MNTLASNFNGRVRLIFADSAAFNTRIEHFTTNHEIIVSIPLIHFMPLQIAVLIFYFEVSFIPFSFTHKSQQHPLYLHHFITA